MVSFAKGMHALFMTLYRTMRSMHMVRTIKSRLTFSAIDHHISTASNESDHISNDEAISCGQYFIFIKGEISHQNFFTLGACLDLARHHYTEAKVDVTQEIEQRAQLGAGV